MLENIKNIIKLNAEINDLFPKGVVENSESESLSRILNFLTVQRKKGRNYPEVMDAFVSLAKENSLFRAYVLDELPILYLVVEVGDLKLIENFVNELDEFDKCEFEEILSDKSTTLLSCASKSNSREVVEYILLLCHNQSGDFQFKRFKDNAIKSGDNFLEEILEFGLEVTKKYGKKLYLEHLKTQSQSLLYFIMKKRFSEAITLLEKGKNGQPYKLSFKGAQPAFRKSN